AFELSEAIGSPVFVRSVTNVSQSHAMIDIEDRKIPDTKLFLEKNINKYTKAGAIIATNQHIRLLAALDKAEELISAKGLHKLNLKEKDGLGVITVGVVNHYIQESINLANNAGCNVDFDKVSTLQLACTIPFANKELKAILAHCSTIIVMEEMEAILEKQIYMLAYQMGVKVHIIGKNDGTYSRLGEFNAAIAAQGFFVAEGKEVPVNLASGDGSAEKLCAARPITVCAGCPHRGTYLSINKAIKKAGYKKDEVMVTGDVGCTILGMNPPFHTLWTEIAMGASIPTAYAYKISGIETPVIATIGDSTFFHGGIAPLINAVQHNINMTVIIMDNGWTAMTGMQVNPGTAMEFQKENYSRLDLPDVVKGLGIKHLAIVDPYNIEETTNAIVEAMALPGVKVVMPRRECAIQANRRKVVYNKVNVIADKCTKCKVCINVAGCPAISLGEDSIVIDTKQCNGCGICAQFCKQKAIETEAI
ncbi:MAG: thiamine pyrophosphate-dependent enzyme, partial [Clostridiales bacterium]